MKMSFQKRIMATFQKQRIDKIVWQPRLEYWYRVNKVRGTLPEKYKNRDLFEIYDDLNASVRYCYGLRPQFGSYLKYTYTGGVKIKTRKEKDTIFSLYDTPLGTLKAKGKIAEWGCSSHYVEFPVKSISDLRILEYVLKNRIVEFDYRLFLEAKEKMGKRGVMQFFYDRHPLQNLMLFHMGVENTIYALYDYPQKMKNFLEAAEQAQDQMYEVLEECPVPILNFGENIDAHIDAPSLFREYLVPYYKRRVAQLHKAGKFCHIHMDGAIKPLLPFINEAGFDGIEAATPLPQGDVNLEELKEAMGETILLDGIPAILFLRDYSYETLEKFTLKLLELFSPNLILGISDEPPPGSDVEKVRFVSQIVERFKP